MRLRTWEDWIVAGILVLFIVFAIIGTLWAYDGDIKCLVAECRRVK